MGMLEEIRSKVLGRKYELSKHAVDQSIIRNISVGEVEEAILGIRVIETPVFEYA